MADLRALPSVDQLLNEPSVLGLISHYGRLAVREAVRETLDDIRNNQDTLEILPSRAEISAEIQNRLVKMFTSTLQPVINATGVILHTNLGRAPLSKAACEAIQNVGEFYSTLEYDLMEGQRGSRSVHTEALLTRISGAEAALVVNNNAAALLLVLTGLLKKKSVVVARSQLVEIGGSFRIPDIMALSGAKLIETGTTNRVHLADYQQVLEQGAAAVLHIHHSNFKIIGFTTEPTLSELAEMTRPRGTLLIEDLGSGTLINCEAYGLEPETTIQETVASGADIVCFSGDKLLGGPQAGILVGKKDLVDKLKKHPLYRALRADKLCLAGLSATLMHYLKNEAEKEIPAWQMIAEPLEPIEQRVNSWIDELKTGEKIESQSTIGGGSLPGETLPTFVLGLKVKRPNQFLNKLRHLPVPIIARIENDMVVFDPRTILITQQDVFISQLKTLIA